MYTIEASAVRLIEFDPHAVGTPLCRSHADRLAPPVGWVLRDERPTPAEAADDAPGEVRSRRSDLEGLLDARTPLLSRAFRAVSPARPEQHARFRSVT